MLDWGELERVPASRDRADLLLNQAHLHLESAQLIAESDPAGGRHVAVLDAVSAQLDPPLGTVLRPFDRLRRRRNQAEYPAVGQPSFRLDDLDRDLPKVRAIAKAAVKVLDQMSPY